LGYSLILSENFWDSLILSKISRDDLIPSDTPYDYGEYDY